MSRAIRGLLALIILSVGCGERGRSVPLALSTTSAGADTRVTLFAAPGLRINARLKPALELEDGTVLRFDSPRLTADSAYFAESPVAMVAHRRLRLHGTLRASVCGLHEQVCRSIRLQL